MFQSASSIIVMSHPCGCQSMFYSALSISHEVTADDGEAEGLIKLRLEPPHGESEERSSGFSAPQASAPQALAPPPASRAPAVVEEEEDEKVALPPPPPKHSRCKFTDVSHVQIICLQQHAGGE